MIETCIIMGIIICIYLLGIHRCTKSEIMYMENVNCLKLIFAIVILFVHVPKAYQNPAQDFIGSFAYLGGSWFCMSSAYGLKYSCNNKKNYVSNWKYRFMKVLIPVGLGMLFDIVLYVLHLESKISFVEYDHVYGWIRILLLFYIEYFLMNAVLSKFWGPRTIDLFLCALILGQSIFDYFDGRGIFSGWYIERIGFVLGIILYDAKDSIEEILKANRQKFLYAFVLLTLTIGLLYLKFKTIGFFGGYILRGLLEISFLLLLVIFSTKWSFNNKLTKYGSIMSYEIYIVHPIVFSVLATFIKQEEQNRMFIPGAVISTLFIAEILNWISKIIKVKVNTINRK